jgi:hypothetical protein
MKILNWLYFDTFHTYEEKATGKEATVKDIPVKDKRLQEKPANEMPDGSIIPDVYMDSAPEEGLPF